MREAIDDIKQAIDILRNGGVVVYPTETVYGLGADALSERAVKKVYDIKKRALDEPISLAVSSYEMMEQVAYVDSLELIKRFLPGPVTILLRKRDSVPDVLTAGSELVGVRLPVHPIAMQLIESFGSAITSTSANISGSAPPRKVDEVKVAADLVLDGGVCKYGIPSTVVDLVNMKIVRKGANYDEVKMLIERYG
ncbi:MAG: L-threonylcarbamoyladenylate synthase [Methanocellales archaeon]|nr:L-threonylcarbamoyladenylate synthase [Methanocellales archaeon]